MNETPVELRHDENGHQFQGLVDGAPLATMQYSRRGDALRLEHTVVDSSARGRGIGAAFVRAVLDDLRATKTRIAVTCPFVTKFIDQNPEYRTLMR